jgi:hypothetical protein
MAHIQPGHPGRAGDRPAVAGLALACLVVVAAGAPCRAQNEPPEFRGPPYRPDLPAVEGGSEAAGPEPDFVRGQLVSRYWVRWTGRTADHDLYETLSMDLGNEHRDAVTGHVMGRIAADLDGETDGSSQFFGLHDAVGKGIDGWLYDAYADLHRVSGFERVRLGRQATFLTPELAFFDGVSADTEPLSETELQFGLYGGLSSHLYESSHSGDWTFGLYGQFRPWTGGRLRLDWMHLEDEAVLGPHENDLLGASVWQTVGPVQIEGQYTNLEGEDRDVRGRLAFVDAESELTLQGTFYQLLQTQGSLVLELDPFYSAMQELYPYWQAGGLIGKGIAEHVEVQAGADVRHVEDVADVGTFNRDYERYYGTLNLYDLVDGLTLAGTGDLWYSEGQDIRTWGADITYRCSEATRVSGGSYYSLYKFDLYLNSERDHVRTYYLRVQHKASKAWVLDGSYEFEQTDLDDFHGLRLGVTWHF